MRLASALLCVLLPACGTPPTPASAREMQLAEGARARGDHASAALHYERAATAADVPRRSEEALYRAADSYARAERLDRAEAIYRTLARSADSERSARADFELAELMARAGRDAEARAQRLLALRRHPESGLAARALTVHLQWLREQEGSEAVLTFLTTEQARLGQGELGETLAYLRARELDAMGRVAAARDAYLLCAERYPYPLGAYWDDALYRAAEAELALGTPARSIGHLERMLAERERASFNGSYERGRYAEAQLKLAHIYRHYLGDARRARQELRRVAEHHPLSRLVDDALFEEALLARDSGEPSGVCPPLTILVRVRADSRYAPCAHLLCADLAPLAGRECRSYIQRDAKLRVEAKGD